MVYERHFPLKQEQEYCVFLFLSTRMQAQNKMERKPNLMITLLELRGQSGEKEVEVRPDALQCSRAYHSPRDSGSRHRGSD